MSLVVPKAASLPLLNKWRTEYLSDVVVHLFKNNVHPSLNSVIGDFQEADFPGYTARHNSFPTPAAINGDGKAEIAAVAMSPWIAFGSSSNVIYGYWLVSVADPAVWWAERFASAVPMTVALNFVGVVPHLTLISEFTG